MTKRILQYRNSLFVYKFSSSGDLKGIIKLVQNSSYLWRSGVSQSESGLMKKVDLFTCGMFYDN